MFHFYLLSQLVAKYDPWVKLYEIQPRTQFKHLQNNWTHGAYSARFRPPIPGEAGHPFRLTPDNDSGGSHPPKLLKFDSSQLHRLRPHKSGTLKLLDSNPIIRYLIINS
jgi:hypothetical protein